MAVEHESDMEKLVNGVRDVHMQNNSPKIIGDGSGGECKDAGLSGDHSQQKSHGNVGEQGIGENNWSEGVKEGLKPHPEQPRRNDEEEEESSDESEEEDSSSEEEITAPIELMGEFLQYVRSGDWENASKLCKMILIYEPENPEALQFQSVITEKMQIEEELTLMSSSSEEESSDEESEEENSEGEGEIQEKTDEEGDSADEDDVERPRSTMKNRLVFPHEPIWKP